VRVEVRPGERLDRDFILRFRLDVHSGADDGAQVTAVAVKDVDGDEGTYVVTVQAYDVTSPPPRDVIILLDRSGSMQGWKMVAARRAAARIVDSLSSSDRFAILAFDNVVEQPAASGLTPADDRNRYRAVEWLSRLEARGGTEMLGAVEAALALVPNDETTPAHSPTIVLVTDGQVGNEDQLVRAVGSRQAVRWFTVGIDQAVNSGLLQRLAAVGGGRCDLVESEDQLDAVMGGLHRRIGHPTLEDVTVDIEGTLPGTLTPTQADVFPGVPLMICGRFAGRIPGQVVVRSGGGRSLKAPVTSGGNPALRPIWARAHLRDLEDRFVAGGDDLDLDELARHMVAVSVRHRVLCRFTAFVAVNEDGEPVEGELHRIMQPVEQPAGWAAHSMKFAGAQITSAPAFRSGAPLMIPEGPTHTPATPAGSGPPIRFARTSSASSETHVEAPQVWPAWSPYRDQIEELLATVARQTVEVGSEAAAVAIRTARRLADDLESVGITGPLVDALRALAAAVASGDDEAASKWAADVGAAIRTPGDRRRPAFWRR
jgi:Ca-activated chloride channel family protein